MLLYLGWSFHFLIQTTRTNPARVSVYLFDPVGLPSFGLCLCHRTQARIASQMQAAAPESSAPDKSIKERSN